MRHWPTLLLLLVPLGAHAGGSGEMPSLVFDIGLCYLLAGALAVLFARLHIPEIAAFLVAGAIAGPFGLSIVTDPGVINTIAELGLILLLFLVGMEIQVNKMLASGRTLVVSGLLQYPLTVLLGVAVFKLASMFGLLSAIGMQGYELLYAGFVIAASSTLLVVKLFQEHLQLDTQTGRIALGLLIFQDFWAIIVIALQGNFASPGIGPIMHTFAGILILLALAVLVAHYLLPRAFRWIAKSPQVVLVAALAWCFLVVLTGAKLDTAAHWLVELDFPIHVGTGMAALIAGAAIASFPYSSEITGKVGIVRDFFVVLFFVGLGMMVPRPESLDVILLALCFALLTVVARYIVFLPLLYLTGLDRRSAFVTSTRLAQASEFSLVIGFLGLQHGHISAEFNSAIIFAFVLTALITPAMYRRADRLHELASPVLDRLGMRSATVNAEQQPGGHPIVLLGFHRITSSLLHEFDQDCPDTLNTILVVDFNIAIHERIRALGPTVLYGDISNEATLHHCSLDTARIIVSSVPDDLLKDTSNRDIVALARCLNPTAVIIANAVNIADRQRIYDAGADYVFVPQVETARVVLEAVEAGLNGDIEPFHKTMDAMHGDWNQRREVM